MPDRHRALSLIVCIALVAPALGAPDPIDGTYAGERVLTKGDPKTCVAKDAISITIYNGSLTFIDSSVKEYSISFATHPDGTFAQLASDAGGLIKDIRGRVTAGVLDATVATANCEHHWHAERYTTDPPPFWR